MYFHLIWQKNETELNEDRMTNNLREKYKAKEDKPI